MSKNTGRLSLGALPRAEKVKLTIAVSGELKALLDAYAEAHSRLHGPVDAAALIPHMLAAFIARDRGFKAAYGSAAKSTGSVT
ncbi:hypothetical protein SRS16CHR_04894 [Variovorax sp. SRS16]|uniref:DUF2274 domain-containing protein n=1 Tax=Variovorax sp. SRS16 TaxID=282217 RepID=UPI001315C32F|nr:DUF2274 domain-containing protein [Variovorax sp. SRS16]VTU31513.1 hypothetical protein SRS16CHR_04894 [Variovorax sp. SRS16]